jgi:hypothetical protein
MGILRRTRRRIVRRFDRLAYIHVPKTGGTYLAQLESDSRPVLSSLRYLGHTYVVDGEGIPNPLYSPRDAERCGWVVPLREVERYCVVSTVRNVFDWLVSYASHAGGWNPRYRNPDHYDFEAANRSFDYLIRSLADREQPWPSRKLIHCQLFCSNGRLVTDWINRNDSLEDDLGALASRMNVSYRPRPRQRVGKRKDYREYYTPELVDLVYRTWGRELRLFGHDFEGSQDAPGALYRAIDPRIKDSVRYRWDDDALVVDGGAAPGPTPDGGRAVSGPA